MEVIYKMKKKKKNRGILKNYLAAVLVMVILIQVMLPVYAASLLTPYGDLQSGISDVDDNNTAVSLTSVFSNGINFGGVNYTQLYISTNGYITFGHGNSSYSPQGITAYTQGPIIAAQYDDLHPGKGGDIYYYQNASEGYVAVTYQDIAPYSTPVGSGSDSGSNSFQIILRRIGGVGSTDFKIELRYYKMDWAKSANNSAWPTAGWSAGNQSSYAELPQSGQSSFRDVLSGSNIGTPGVYSWDVTGGIVKAQPTVNQTDTPTSITGSSAVSGGNVSSDGGLTVTSRGLAYSTTPNPTISNNTVISGSGLGAFTATMTGLSPNTTYYVRAFATNSLGTGYGPQVSFTTQNVIPTTITASGAEPEYFLQEPAVPVDSGLTVSSTYQINGGKVYITDGFQPGDILCFTNQGGITGSYNSSNGVLTLTGTANAAQYQAALRTVTFRTTNNNLGTRKIIFSLGSNTVFYPETGHYYEYISSPGLSWSQAKQAAEEKTFLGMQGYLATITSQGENEFVASKCAGDGWLGGSDNGHDKQWYWVTGPEGAANGGQGTKFCTQNAYTGQGTGVGVASTEPGLYQNFKEGEPNDWYTQYDIGRADGENYLHMYASDESWNDYAENNSYIEGYLVEYGGMPGDPEPQENRATMEKTLTVGTLDADAPTITANPESGEVDLGTSILLTFSDEGGIGLAYQKYALSAGTATPASGWSNESNNAVGTVTLNNSGVWYIHYKAEDIAGNVLEGYKGPYTIPMITSGDYQINNTVRVIMGVPSGTAYNTFMGKIIPCTDVNVILYRQDGVTQVTSGNITNGMKLKAANNAGQTVTYTIMTSAEVYPSEIVVPGINTNLSGDDNNTGAIDLGFGFSFYGNNYTSGYISTNGLVTFGSGSRVWTNTNIPGSDSPNNMIAAFWDDLIVQSGKKTILYKTLGTEPNRKFVTQWTNMYFYYNPSLQMGTFQAILYEGTNEIQVQYRELMGSNYSLGSSATVGIENSSGNKGVKYSYNFAQLASRKAIRFIPDGSGNYIMNSNAVYDPIYLYDTELPGMPVLISPSNDGSGINRPVAFDWEPGGNTNSYRLLAATDSNFANLVLDQSTSATEYTDSANRLSANTTYYWKIIANNSKGSTASAPRTFTTGSSGAPVISAIPDQAIEQNDSTAPLGFTVSDLDTDISSVLVSATSSDQSLIPDSSIVIGGSGESRTVTITPAADKSGAAAITILANDGDNVSASTFVVRVNNAPGISDIGNFSVQPGEASAPVSFTVSDTETDEDDLIVSAVSSDTSVVPNSAINLGGSGANRTISITPNSGRTAAVTITVAVADEAASTASDSFVVSVGNTPPTVSSSTKQGIEDTVMSFAAGDFTSSYRDTEANPLAKVKITELPQASAGLLKLNDTTITVNQEINSTEMGAISFVPSANWNGTAYFGWKASDGSSYSMVDAIMTVKLAAVNDISGVTNFAKSGNEDSVIAFTRADFENSFTDVDGTLSQIQILSVPDSSTVGVLKVGSTNILANTIISASNLSNITFVPNPGYYGETTFSWRGHDGVEYSANDAEVTITINHVNHAPTIGSFTVSGIEDNETVFGAVYFENSYNDADGDMLNIIVVESLPDNGTLKLNGSSVSEGDSIAYEDLLHLSFATQQDWNGSTFFMYRAGDGEAVSGSAAVNVTVAAVNDRPVVEDSEISGMEDTQLDFSIDDFEGAYRDADNDALVKIRITELPQNGLLRLNGVELGEGSEVLYSELRDINFVPVSDWSGTTSFSWEAFDGTVWSDAAAEIDIDIQAVNDAPVVGNGSMAGLEEDETVSFESNDFIGRYSDTEDDSLAEVRIVQVPRYGTLYKDDEEVSSGDVIFAEELDGLSYTPDRNFNGIDAIIWEASDGNEFSINSAVLSLNIEASNDKPTITDGIDKTADEDDEITFEVSDFLSVFSDDDEDDNAPMESDTLNAIQITSLPQFGVLELDNEEITVAQAVYHSDIGSMAFIPDPDWNGSTSFNFKVFDGLEWSDDIGTVDITINPINDVPAVMDIGITVEEDSEAFSGTLSASDIDGDDLSFTLGEGPVHGDAEVYPDGTFEYEPDEDFYGADSFTFEVTDDNGGTAAAEVVVNVLPQNDAPIAEAFSAANNEDLALNFTKEDFSGYFNDSKDNGRLMQAIITELPISGTLVAGSRNVNAGDIIAYDELDSLSYVPRYNYHGVDSFRWKGSDGYVYSEETASVTITVNMHNHAPSVSSFTKSGTEDMNLVFADTDFSDGFVDVDEGEAANNTLTGIRISTLPQNGTLKDNGITINAADYDISDIDNITYTPDPDFFGIDTFGWRGYDGADYSEEAAVYMDIAGINDAPAALASTAAANEDAAYTFREQDFLYSDADGDSLSQVIILALPDHGTLKLGEDYINADTAISLSEAGNLIYMPDTDYFGFDNFSWKANDGTVTSEEAADMTFSVGAVNDAPAAYEGKVNGEEETAYTFADADFESLYSDAEGDSLQRIVIVSVPSPEDGILTFNGIEVVENMEIDKADIDKLVFEPAENRSGTAGFTWKAFGGELYSEAANMGIELLNINDAPVALSSSVATDENEMYTFSVQDFSYSDADGDLLSQVIILTLPNNGVLKLGTVPADTNTAVSADDIANLVYIPDADYNGTDAFTWKVYDGILASEQAAAMTINVAAVNYAPVALENSVAIAEDEAYTFEVQDFLYSDRDGDGLYGITASSLPEHGLLKLGSEDVTVNTDVLAADIGSLRYVPDADYYGIDTFRWKASDGTVTSAETADMRIDITQVNDAPAAFASSVATAEDEAYTFKTQDFLYGDADGSTLYGIRISNLPSHGILKINGLPVDADTAIAAEEIESLIYIPDVDFYGTDSFMWKADDGIAVSAEAVPMTIYVSMVNSSPISSDAAASVTAGANLQLGSSMFIIQDADGDELVSIKIVALPEKGVLKLEGTAVTAGNAISVLQLDKLSYTPQIGFAGTDTIGWKGYDGKEYSDNTAVLSIVVDALPRNDSDDEDDKKPEAPPAAPVQPDNGTQGNSIELGRDDLAGYGSPQEGSDNDGSGPSIVVGDKNHETVEVIIETRAMEGLLENGANINNGTAIRAVSKAGEIEVDISELSAENLSKQTGITEDKLKEAKVIVSISPQDKEATEALQGKISVSSGGKVEIVGPVIDFKVSVETSDGQQTEVQNLEKHTGRKIEINGNDAEKIINDAQLQGIDINSLTVAAVDKLTGEITPVPARITVNSDGSIEIEVKHNGTGSYTLLKNNVTVKTGDKHWADNVARNMARKYMLDEIFGDEIDLNMSLTRAEVSTVMLRVLGVKRSSYAISSEFSDVDAGHSLYREIMAANTLGIIRGYGDTTIKPDRVAIREEMAAIVYRTISQMQSIAENTAIAANYRDFDNIGKWATGQVGKLTEIDIFEGRPGEKFDPKDGITLGEALEALNRLTEYILR